MPGTQPASFPTLWVKPTNKRVLVMCRHAREGAECIMLHPQNLEIWKITHSKLLAALGPWGTGSGVAGQSENRSLWKVECLSFPYPRPTVDSLSPYAVLAVLGT